MPMVFDQNAARWACQKRGLCCRTYRIGVMDEEGRRISSMLAAAADPLAPLFSPAPEQLPVDDQGACVFLDGSLCGYRQRHGPETLPAACRRYPRLALRTPERTLLELSLACPTALDLFVQRPRPSFATGDVPLADDIAFDVRTSEVEYRDLAGGPLDAATFWEQHRVLCDRFSAMRGDPLTRLLDWTAEFAGVPIVPIALDWTTAIAGDDDSLPLPYLLQGGDLPLLAMLLAATPSFQARVKGGGARYSEAQDLFDQFSSRVGVFRDLSQLADPRTGEPQPLFSVADVRKVFHRGRVRLSGDGAMFLARLANTPGAGGLRSCRGLVEKVTDFWPDEDVTARLLHQALALQIGPVEAGFIVEELGAADAAQVAVG